MNDDQPQATVTQADRDAVQAFHHTMLLRLMSDVKSQRPKLGDDEGDAGTLVQAFARHRLAFASSASAEAIKASAEVSLMYLQTGFAECPQCGEEVPTKTLDAAYELATVVQPAPTIGGTVRAEPIPGAYQHEEVEGRFWLIVHEPGKVPDRKGSWPRSQLPQIMREFIVARPNAYLTVLTVGVDGSPDVQHGPEALQMADGRSMRTGSAHNARTLAAHSASACTCGSPYYDAGAHLSTCPAAAEAVGLADPVAWEPEVGSAAAIARAKRAS